MVYHWNYIVDKETHDVHFRHFHYVRISEPNKLYDFCEAKLPIISNNGYHLEKLLRKKIGLCFDKIEDITKKT